MKKRTYELIVILLFLAFCGVMLSEGLTKNVLPTAFVSEFTKPYDFPNVALIVIAVLCLFLLVKTIIGMSKDKKQAAETPDKRTEEEKAVAKTNLMKSRITLGLIIVYVILWKFLGFFIATPIFVFAECMVLPEKRVWWKALACAGATTVACYLVFTLLFQIHFPNPLF